MLLPLLLLPPLPLLLLSLLLAINLEGMLLALEGILGEIVAVGKLLDQLGQQVVIPIMQRHPSQH